MKVIMEEIIDRVYNGEKFHIDFEKRNMKVGKEYLIKDGQYDESKYILSKSMTHTGLKDVLETIENLYLHYRYSMPSERSENKRRKYFKALAVDELTVEDMVNGELREVMQAKLESYILCKILKGELYWDENWGSFFWQSKKSPDLIILRKWIEK